MSITPMSDEARDVPPVTTDLVYLLGVIVLVLCFAAGTGLGSWLLHTWDAEIRQAIAWAWQQLTALFWAWASVNF